MEKTIPRQKHYESIANTIIKNLRKRQIEGYYCPDRKSGIQKVLELIPIGSSISWGGSMTLEETGLLDSIRLNRNLPCTITGKCEDCYSPDCMCGQIVITRHSGIPNLIKVILIGEELGY